MSDRSDKQLVRDFLAGDKEAFDEIVKRYSKSVYRLSYKYTHNSKDAEDIAQDTFLRAYENLRKYPKEIELKPWLLKISTNLCRNLAKKKKSFSFSDLEDKEEGRMEERLKNDGDGPKEKLKEKDEKKIVGWAVRQLPDKYQLVIQLRYHEDLTYQEISEVLNLPLNTVKIHLNRAKAKVKIYLNAFYEN